MSVKWESAQGSRTECIYMSTISYCSSYYYLAILRDIWQRGWLKGSWIVHFCIKQQWSHNFSFPSSESVMWAFSHPHTELQTCDYALELTLLIFVRKSHSVAGRCVITFTLSACSCDFYKIKNACAVHVINPQGPWTGMCVFMQLRSRRHPFGKGTNVLNVPFMQIRKYRESGLRKEGFSQQPC